MYNSLHVEDMFSPVETTYPNNRSMHYIQTGFAAEEIIAY